MFVTMIICQRQLLMRGMSYRSTQHYVQLSFSLSIPAAAATSVVCVCYYIHEYPLSLVSIKSSCR